ncbi:MAG: YvrJ family protein [Enterococcus faecalis]
MDLQFFEDLLLTIGNYGFPLILAIYLLVRFESKIQALTNSIDELKDTMSDCQRNK